MDLLRWFEAGPAAGGPAGADVMAAWAPDPEDGVRTAPDWVEIGPVLFREPRVVLAGARHPLAGRESIDAEELAEHVLIRPWGYAGWADAWAPSATPGGRPITRVQQTRYTYAEDLPDVLADGTILHLVASSAGPLITRGSTLVAVEIRGLPPAACQLFWSQDSGNPWVRPFAEAAAAACAVYDH
jgi:DNA-binding transcriptional LysR family regulator